MKETCKTCSHFDDYEKKEKPVLNRGFCNRFITTIDTLKESNQCIGWNQNPQIPKDFIFKQQAKKLGIFQNKQLTFF